MALTRYRQDKASAAWTLWCAYRSLEAETPGICISSAQRLLAARGHVLRGAAALWRVVKRGQAALESGREPALVDFVPTRDRSTESVEDPVDLALRSDAFRAKLELLYIATMSASSEGMLRGRRTGNMSLVLRRMAEEPECPEFLRPELAQGRQPLALRRYLRKRFTPEIEARLRGQRHWQLQGLVSRRADHVQLPDGRRCATAPGYLVELDDMSLNHPFCVPDGTGGWILTRQGLYARDSSTRRWLGFTLIARPREAYRAEDILRFLRGLMQDYGRFDCLRMEHGVWAARSVTGWEIGAGGELSHESVWRVPEADPAEVERVTLGLAEIGVRIDTAQHAHSKGLLEGGFRELQDTFSTYAFNSYVNIGHHRGEWEEAAKRLRQARDGRDPASVGFMPIGTAAELMERAMRFVNARGADERWEDGISGRPLPQITRDQFAPFLPECREVTVRGGKVTVTVRGEPLDFRCETMVRLGAGYPLAIRFDPSEPSIGAAIYNRMAPENPANFDSWPLGQFLGWAEWEMPGPQLRVTLEESVGLEPVDVDAGLDRGDAIRRQQQHLVLSEYRSLPKAGPAVRRSDARDGHGRVARIETAPSETGTRSVQPAATRRTTVRHQSDYIGARSVAPSVDDDPELAALVAECAD